MSLAHPLPGDQMANEVVQPLPVVRETVRDLLLSSAAYHSLDSHQRQEIAQALVQVCHTAVSLIKEEARSDGLALAQSLGVAATTANEETLPEPIVLRKQPIAMAQNAGQQFS